MAEPKENPLMEKIVSLCKRRGFIFQSSEIYGGINGFWDYGPLGAELKRNVKELWWNTMTRQRDDVAGLEATIIMSPEIWKASGHVATFADLMVECFITKKRFRADQVEPQAGIIYHYRGAVDKTKVKEHWDSAFKNANTTVGEIFAQAFLTLSDDHKKGMIVLYGKADQTESEFLSYLLTAEFKSKAMELISDYNDLVSIRVLKILNDYWENISQKINEPYSVLIPKGKPAGAARHVATQYYR